MADEDPYSAAFESLFEEMALERYEAELEGRICTFKGCDRPTTKAGEPCEFHQRIIDDIIEKARQDMAYSMKGLITDEPDDTD